MRTIGITGGVGAGKSLILDYIKEHYRAKIYRADEIAHQLQEPGESCYQPLIDLFEKEILSGDGRIDKAKMAERIFTNDALLEKVNAIVHPCVREYVLREIGEQRQKGEIDFFVLEAALLIEEKYDEILDELWFIRADADIRRERLKQSRGYSDVKIESIMGTQLSDEEFHDFCAFTIENNRGPEEAYRQIDEKMGDYIGAENKY